MGRSKPVGSQVNGESFEKHVGEWKKGGLSQPGYCRSQGINIKSFGYWKRRLSAVGMAITLLEVSVSKAAIMTFR